MTAARDVVLGRVRRAIAEAAAGPVSREFRREGLLDSRSRVELLCERISDYRAEVRRVANVDLEAAIADAFESRGAKRIGIPPGIPVAWRPRALDLVIDTGLSPAELDGLDGVLTGCTVAIAETGTLVLTAAPEEGPRALTLVPDLHVCVVDEEQIVELVPEAIAALAGLATRPLTFISGPSATSDIELCRVEGVHGPRTLIVLVTSREHT
jgi:L-lactate dehydrogenase complex protein LldG